MPPVPRLADPHAGLTRAPVLLLANVLALATGSGCVPDTAGPARTTPGASASAAAASASAGADASANERGAVATTGVGATSDGGVTDGGVTMPESKSTWRSTPTEQNGFYAVLDGLCSKLGVGTLGKDGKDVVVHYGGESMYTSERTGQASFIALRDKGLESIGDPGVASPTGIAGRSLEDFWVADSTGSRSSEGAVLHRRIGSTWKTYAKDQTNLHAWLDGGIIGTGGLATADGTLWVEGSSTRPPAAVSAGFGYMFRIAAFPTGEVVVAGRPETEGTAPAPAIARHWSRETGLKQHSLAMLGEGDWPTIVETAPDELYAWVNRKVARFDGKSWRLLGTTASASPIRTAFRAAPDEVWVILENGAVERSGAKGFAAVTTPEPALTLSGVDKNAPWMIGTSGKLYKREGETWKNVPLPRPPFAAKSIDPNATIPLKLRTVLVGAADDVLVVGQYWEKGLGWKEQELHHVLFRTKAPTETLRCNEPDPENNNVHIGRGFQSWPPLATAACTTPFVVLARRSNALKVPPSDWPKLRAAVKGHPELGDVSLVEFRSGDRTFVGAKAKDFEAGKAIATLATGKDRVRPEIVCGAPEALRTIDVDLATGNVTRDTAK